MSDEESPEGKARTIYLIPQKLPEPGEPTVSIGDWPPEIIEEAHRRGMLPVVQIMFPDDRDQLIADLAARAAFKVANDSIAEDPIVTAVADQVAEKAPQVGQVVAAPFLMRIEDYGTRCGYSASHIKRLIAEGLPTVGDGKARRVHVERADRWIEASYDEDELENDNVVALAVANARKRGGK